MLQVTAGVFYILNCFITTLLDLNTSGEKKQGVTTGLTSLRLHAESGVHIKSFLCTEGMGNNVISPHYRTLRERERGRKRENESKKEIITHIIRSVWTSVSICSLSIVVSIYMSCYKFTFYCGKISV